MKVTIDNLKDAHVVAKAAFIKANNAKAYVETIKGNLLVEEELKYEKA